MINRITLLVLLAAACARPARAQTLSDVLTFLVTNQAVDTGSPERDRAAAQAASETVTRALLSNLATLPIASSSGAFVYRLNPELGTVQRATQTFGTFFIERALTARRADTSVGLTLQRVQFTSLDGRNLRDGSLVTTANQFVDESAPYEVDTLRLNIDASMVTLYGTLGVTDRLEIGAAVPMVSLSINGSRTDTYRGRAFTQATGSGHAIGVADLLLRTKYRLYDGGRGALAAAADVRLPTGREQDLLGAGSTSLKLSAVGSLESGRTSTHASAGVSFGGLAREIDYGAAVAFAAAARLSLVGEVLGRWVDSSGHIVAVTARHPLLTGVNTVRLSGDASSLRILTVVPGLKWNLTDTWVLGANVSMPLTTGGLTARFTPFIGLDYALGR